MLFWRALLVINDWQPRAVIIKARAEGEGLNDNCSRLTVINPSNARQKSIICIIITIVKLHVMKFNKPLRQLLKFYLTITLTIFT